MLTTNYGPLTHYTDQLLAEIAARIQLSPSRHRQAVQRYETVAKWLERDGSLLQGNVSQMYPQGSMAIGATILSRNSDDRYDIDVSAELDLPQDSSPQIHFGHTVPGRKGRARFPILCHDTPGVAGASPLNMQRCTWISRP